MSDPIRLQVNTNPMFSVVLSEQGPAGTPGADGATPPDTRYWGTVDVDGMNALGTTHLGDWCTRTDDDDAVYVVTGTIVDPMPPYVEYPIWTRFTYPASGGGLTVVTASDVDTESATDGQVLTSDGAGVASWQTPTGGGGTPIAPGIVDLSPYRARTRVGMTDREYATAYVNNLTIYSFANSANGTVDDYWEWPFCAFNAGTYIFGAGYYPWSKGGVAHWYVDGVDTGERTDFSVSGASPIAGTIAMSTGGGYVVPAAGLYTVRMWMRSTNGSGYNQLAWDLWAQQIA